MMTLDIDELLNAPDVIPQWELKDAVELCIQLETIAPFYGCHVALTGGCLYKPGLRKDVDIMFYRIRQISELDKEGLLNKLYTMGFVNQRTFGWVTKCEYTGKGVDLFFPDHIVSNVAGECNGY